MAGFFGMFDYAKPGKGVGKNEPPRSRFAHFWELFFRKFWRLVQLNLLYLLFCVPIVTIGPATAGLTYVLRNMATEQPVFLFSDFWQAFRDNWKQSLLWSLLLGACGAVISVSTQFYFLNMESYRWMFLPAALALFAGLMLLMMSYYAMLMIVTLELSLGAVLKNAAILAILCLRTNLLTLLFTGLLIGATVLLLPVSALAVLALVPAWVGFIICYNSYPGIKLYVIDPFQQSEQEPPGADGVFRDREPGSPEED